MCTPSLTATLSRVALVATLIGLDGCVAHSASTLRPRRGDSVNAGYGLQARRDVTGAIASLDGDVARRSSPTTIADMMEGRFAGVEVQRLANGGVSVRIRGQHSFGNSEPLYVIDGVPQSQGARTLADLNPADVKRIDVLKDAGATAIYGSRGANGVILITMRRWR